MISIFIIINNSRIIIKFLFIIMKKHLKKDLKIRKLVYKYEKNKLVLKAISRNLLLSSSIRFETQLKLSKLPKDSSIVRVKNYSPVNYKSRAILTKYGIDRITFREWGNKGIIPGVTPYSW